MDKINYFLAFPQLSLLIRTQGYCHKKGRFLFYFQFAKNLIIKGWAATAAGAKLAGLILRLWRKIGARDFFLNLFYFLFQAKKLNADFYLVIPIGFEPMTASLENLCSIQLSYGIKKKTNQPI